MSKHSEKDQHWNMVERRNIEHLAKRAGVAGCTGSMQECGAVPIDFVQDGRMHCGESIVWGYRDSTGKVWSEAELRAELRANCSPSWIGDAS